MDTHNTSSRQENTEEDSLVDSDDQWSDESEDGSLWTPSRPGVVPSISQRHKDFDALRTSRVGRNEPQSVQNNARDTPYLGYGRHRSNGGARTSQ